MPDPLNADLVALLETHTPWWFPAAACRNADTSIFFPSLGQTLDEARAICATCPVTAACCSYAKANHLDVGVFGGLSPSQRRQPTNGSATDPATGQFKQPARVTPVLDGKSRQSTRAVVPQPVAMRSQEPAPAAVAAAPDAGVSIELDLSPAPAAVAALCSRLGVTIEDLRSRSRNPRIIEARAVAAWLLVGHHHWTTAAVGVWLGRHHGHVRRLVTEAASGIRRDAALAEAVYACRLRADGVLS